MWQLDLDEVGWPRHRRAAPEPPEWATESSVGAIPVETQAETQIETQIETEFERFDPEPWRPAIHLPLADPYQAPEGYWIKGNTHSGLYYTPDSELYDNTLPEVWFASEELAQANGFFKAPE
jgi:uncharacterized protein with LGFP repeats